MKILLTGATGFVGMNFVERYYNKYDIVALVRKSSKIDKIKNKCKIYYYDENIEQILNHLKKENIQGVVHLATLYLKTFNTNDIRGFIESNIAFGLELLNISMLSNIKFFINTITFSQFANSVHYKPKTLYDATKQAFMDLSKFYSSYFDIFNLMIYDTYGKNDTRPKIFNIWKNMLLKNTSMDMSPGQQKIDISYIDDVVNGINILIQNYINKQATNNQIYTLENDRYSLKELAIIFESIAQAKLKINWGARNYLPNEIMNPISSKDTPNIIRLPNWNPKISLKEGIREILKN
ncbi:NAD(P)-dependent oxidoreductase [Campylobacter lari]|nr:NAD(P)-dependent oxidoreductase [Campylobacter lari]HEC1758166.1 NAD(P)-dependent oxidoreductase [Campylobacter lari]HEC1773122.1 NAD(P)-dependent oxidoreductase [Campylobacter lari]